MSEEALQQKEVQESSTEDRARTMGWLPKEEFRGNPDRWTDADTFVRRAEQELPIARATQRKLERELAEMKATFREFSAHHQKTAEREYAKALRDLKAQQKQAVAEADTEKYDAIEKEIEQVQNERPVAAPKQVNEPDPDFVEWYKENPWYASDKRMRKVADVIAQDMMEDGTSLRGKDFLDAIKKEVKSRFPEKFENERKSNASSVGAVGRQDLPSGKRGKSYNDLPHEARAVCDRYVKAGLLTKEQYVKDFFEE